MAQSAPAPPVVQPSLGNAIVLNPCQRLNPVLAAIRNVPTEFGDIVPDFQVGRTTCVLYLSLKYHRLHPEYIHHRIEKLGHTYNLRILMIMCDISEHQEPIRELTKTCLINNITVIVAFSNEEAAHYLTTFKQFEHKSPDLIKERVEKDYRSILRSALTSIKGINKTDVETLRSNCSSFAGISSASEQTLLNLPGLAQTKVRRLRDAFHKPFRTGPDGSVPLSTSSQPQQPQQQQEGSAAAAALPSHSEKTSDDSAKPRPKRPREASPPATHAAAAAAAVQDRDAAAPPPPRPPSPVWDIELDLNDDTPSPPGAPSNLLGHPEPAHKKQRADQPSPARLDSSKNS